MRAWWLLALFVAVSARAAPVPPALNMGVEGGATLRAFANHEDISWMAEAAALNQTDSRNYKDLTLGGYDQLLPWLKAGAFYRRAYGLRHDDDWIKIDNDWQWNNTNSRAEDFAILDVSPRWQLGENWLLECKVRYLWNTFDSEKTLMLRPGATYFWMREGQPFFNFFVQLEEDLPLNYGNRKVDEQWMYFGSLYHVGHGWDVGGFAAWSWQTWQTSASYLEKNGAAYSVTAQATVLSLLAIYQFPY